MRSTDGSFCCAAVWRSRVRCHINIPFHSDAFPLFRVFHRDRGWPGGDGGGQFGYISFFTISCLDAKYSILGGYLFRRSDEEVDEALHIIGRDRWG